jgi:hypothetical protein
MEIEGLKELYNFYNAEWEEVNIFGVRNEKDADKDQFNDIIGIATDTEIFRFVGTTDPGQYWVKNPITYNGVTGAAHLVEGFYKGVWMIGLHAANTNFSHEAFLQIGNAVSIWRDVNENNIDDGEPRQKGYFGINLHRASVNVDAQVIGNYSAGCQVIRNVDDFRKLLSIAKESNNYKTKGSRAQFSYLLMNRKEVGDI